MMLETFFQLPAQDKINYKNITILPSTKFFETFLHNFFGSSFNIIKLKLKDTRPRDLVMLKYISKSEEVCAFYEQVLIPFFNLYCFLNNIDFSGESANVFFNKIKKRNYINPIIWFIKNPYKIFAETVKEILLKKLYAKNI